VKNLLISGLVTLLVALDLPSAVARAQEHAQNSKQFLQELLSNHKELQKRYDNLIFKGSMSNGSRKRPREYVRLEGMFRVISQMPPGAKNPAPIADGKVFLHSRKRYYELQKSSAGFEYALVFTDTKLPPMALQDLLMLSPYASFLFVGRSLQEWLEDPGFKVESVSLHGEAQQAELTFAYDSGHKYNPKEGYPPMRGTIYFDKGNMWSISKVAFFVILEDADNTKKELGQSIVVNYGDKVSDVALPHVTEHRAAGVAEPLSQFHIESLTKAQLQYEDFTPKAYGLPVPLDDDVPKSSGFKLWVGLAVGGVILLIAAYLIRRRRTA
jgi:hypothetical protein